MSGRLFLTHGAGYLFNDNRASGEGLQEADMGICPHCQKVINLQMWRAADGSTGKGWCMKCMSPCCGNGPCASEFAQKGCLPYLKKIEKMLTEEHAKMQFRRVAGLEPEQPTMFIKSGMS
jgi:hypothetical protein